MSYSLPDLPYDFNALEPEIDSKTMEIHHGKHHAGYVSKLNASLEGHDDLQGLAIVELLGKFADLPEEIKVSVRNNGGGHANHSLFWEVLTDKEEDREFIGEIKEAIENEFGSFDSFKEKFSEEAAKRFGSGWAWLVLNNGELEVYSTANQDSPILEGKKPILGLDVWEHAYYLNYQNRRPDYISAFFTLINWKKVNELYLLYTNE